MVRFPLPRAEGIGELIDDPGIALDELSANLQDLERLNRLFGGTRLILHYLEPVFRRTHAGEVQILDVATGGADIPAAIVRWARRQGWRVRIVGSDKNPQVLRAADRNSLGRMERWCGLRKRGRTHPLTLAPGKTLTRRRAASSSW